MECIFEGKRALGRRVQVAFYVYRGEDDLTCFRSTSFYFGLITNVRRRSHGATSRAGTIAQGNELTIGKWEF
jgi:hypothetical protein